jgi:hypothetical protein
MVPRSAPAMTLATKKVRIVEIAHLLLGGTPFETGS